MRLLAVWAKMSKVGAYRNLQAYEQPKSLEKFRGSPNAYAGTVSTSDSVVCRARIPDRALSDSESATPVRLNGHNAPVGFLQPYTWPGSFSP